MAYRFHVDSRVCVNCGICMDLCPVRCLDMSRPSGDGEAAAATELRTPVPGSAAAQPWMMLAPVQTAPCIGCQVCAQECPTNAIIIEHSAAFSFAKSGPLAHVPADGGWHPLDDYTRATPEEPGEAPWGENHAWHVAERVAVWQSWRTWLGRAGEELRAPCQAACPVGTNAGLYVSLVGEGRYAEAARVAAETNPFPSICGRVCTAPCESVCRRAEFDAPIAIRDLKRYAMDHGGPRRDEQVKFVRRYDERVAVVGAGPTGLSAAFYLARRGYSVTVFDALPVPGGMMAIGIPDYRLPRAELNRDIAAITALGVEIKLNTALGRDVTLTQLQGEFAAVLLAVGAQRSQRLNVPGELDYAGVVPATTFLKQFNLDPRTTLTGAVAVIGGGSTAMDAARSAVRAGAGNVTVIYRRTQAEMPAQPEEVRAALEEGVVLRQLTAPVAVLGVDGHASSVRCQRMALGEPDASGRPQPIPIPASEFAIPVDTILIAVGEAPDPSFLPEGTSVGVAPWGGLLVNPSTLATGAPGIFAAGDVTYGPKSVVHAAGHGRRAAHSIHGYLRHLSPAQIDELADGEAMTASTLPPDGHVHLSLRSAPRQEMSLRVVRDDRSAETATGFNEEQARREASRCLRCDLAYLCPSVVLRDRVATTTPA